MQSTRKHNGSWEAVGPNRGDRVPSVVIGVSPSSCRPPQHKEVEALARRQWNPGGGEEGNEERDADATGLPVRHGNTVGVNMRTMIVLLCLLTAPAWSQENNDLAEEIMRFVVLPCYIQIAVDRGVPEDDLAEFVSQMVADDPEAIRAVIRDLVPVLAGLNENERPVFYEVHKDVCIEASR